MPTTRRSGYLLVLGVAAGALVADQLTKWWALRSLQDRDIGVIGSLRFHLTYNTGASFSIGGRHGPWIALVALVVVALLLWQGRSVDTRIGAVALGLVVGGALGNVVDRAMRGDGLFRGAVVDFIDLQWWPVFNVADMAVVVGGVLLVLNSLRRQET